MRPSNDAFSLLNRLPDGVSASIATKHLLLADESLLTRIVAAGIAIAQAFDRGNCVILAGNGGSAADAPHLAAEFVSRFEFDRPGLPSLSLSTDTSMITPSATTTATRSCSSGSSRPSPSPTAPY